MSHSSRRCRRIAPRDGFTTFGDASRPRGRLFCLASGPKDFDWIPFKNAVGRHENHLFEDGLGNEQPIKGIAVMGRKGVDGEGMRMRDRQGM